MNNIMDEIIAVGDLIKLKYISLSIILPQVLFVLLYIIVDYRMQAAARLLSGQKRAG